MSNRHQRRSNLAQVKREAHAAHLLKRTPRREPALNVCHCCRGAYWRTNIPQRRPVCPACKANYADDAAQPGSVLIRDDSCRTDKRRRFSAVRCAASIKR